MQKRILIFSIAYEPYVGGAEVALREITKRIPEMRFELITLRFGPTDKAYEEVGNIRIHRIGPKNKYLFPFFAYAKARTLHRKDRFDVVWSMMANYAGFAGLFFKTFHKDVPFLLSLQEGDPIAHIKKRVRLVYPFFKKIFERADEVQAISRHLARFGKDMGFPREPVIIPNGVDIVLFRETRKWPRGKEAKVLITASRLVQKNAVDDIIKALPLLPRPVKLVVLGTGPLEEELKTLARSLGLVDRVGFFGFVGHESLPWYLNKADIFVRPSRSEGLGNSFLEAMANGLPVVGTAVGGIPDFLMDGKTGLLCETDSPASVAEKVRLLLDEKNRSIVESMIKNARELVERKYSWDIVASNMRDLLRRMS